MPNFLDFTQGRIRAHPYGLGVRGAPARSPGHPSSLLVLLVLLGLAQSSLAEDGSLDWMSVMTVESVSVVTSPS